MRDKKRPRAVATPEATKKGFGDPRLHNPIATPTQPNLREVALELAQSTGADPRDIQAAIALMRSGRADLLEQVLAGRLGAARALKLARGR